MAVALVGWVDRRAKPDDPPNYEPNIEQGVEFTVIDLRADDSIAAGRCLVACDPAALPSGAVLLGDAPLDTSRWATQRKRQIGNALGVTLNADRLADVALEVLTEHADAARADRWNPLRPTHQKRWEIWLGNERIVNMPAPGGGAYYATDFTTADSTTLGPDQSWTEYGTGNPQIVSNSVRVTSIAQANGAARADADVDSVDHTCSVELYIQTNAGHGAAAACCRFDSGAQTYYYGGRNQSSISNNVTVGKYSAGAHSALGTVAFTWLIATTYQLRCIATGSTVIARKMSAGANLLEVAVTDTSITGGTRGGLQVYANTGAARALVDSWVLMDLRTQPLLPIVHSQAVHRASRW